MEALQETDFPPSRQTGAVDHDFIRNMVPKLLQDVDLQTRIQAWFMHYGAPAHFLLAVREFLNTVFPGQWIGRGGPTAWPARPLI